MNTNKKDVIVIGAGISGVMSAYFLLKRGYAVTLLDREKYPAMACSRANGGQISVCNAETWNQVQYIKKGLKWMFTKDAPFLVKPSFNIDKLLWLGRFVKETYKNTYVENTLKTIDIAVKSSNNYKNIINEHNLSFDKNLSSGMLHVYTNKTSFESAEDTADMFNNNGVQWKFLDKNEITSIQGLDSFRNVYGGFITETDWTGDPHLFCRELINIMLKNENFETLFGYEVTQVEDTYIVLNPMLENKDVEIALEYEKLVVCNGWEIDKIASKYGDSLGVYPVKGYSITIENAYQAPSVSLLDDDKKIVSSKLGNRFRIAGTAELADGNLDIRKERIQPLLNWVHENFPFIDTSSYQSWACNRPMTPNMMPVVKQSQTNPNIFYHGGHGHLGWTLSGYTGELLSEIVK